MTGWRKVAVVVLVPVTVAVLAGWAGTLPGARAAEPSRATVILAAGQVRDGGGAVRGTMSEPATSLIETTDPTPQRGDCSQVRAAFLDVRPDLADVGVRLAERESMCCPEVRGGDVVDESCRRVDISTFSHRSDAGLFQLNGVWHRPPDGVLCTDLGICGPDAVTALSVRAQVVLFVWIVDRFGLCHWSPPRYCA